MTSRVGGPIQPSGMALPVKPTDNYVLMFKDGVWKAAEAAAPFLNATELGVANAASPTELNGYGAAVPDWRLVYQSGAASDAATLYRLDASSDAQSLPYIVDSLTSGLKWVAVAGRYVNGEVTASTGFTGPHLRANSSAGLLLENSNGDDVALLGAGPGTGTTFYGGVVLDAETASRIVTTGASKDLDTPAAISTAQTLTLSTATGTTLTVSSTTDSTSKDTGSIVTEGGIGAELGITAGTHVRARNASIGALGVATETKTDPETISAWSATQHSMLAGPANSTTASGLGVSLNQTTAEASFVCITPGTAWRKLSFFGSDFQWNPSGSTTNNVTISSTGALTSQGATAGIGYGTGAGGTVTQATSRTTGVTLNKICGQITLVSAAGSSLWQSFTVTNSAVAAGDTVLVCQKSGTDLYQIHVTAVAAGSFQVTFATTGGATTEQPVFTFAVIKAVAA